MKKLNTISMGIKNLRQQITKTSVMVAFSFILTMSIFVSSVLAESMQQSVEKTINRMGADIIVVPEEFQTDYTDALFSGELCTFYLDKKWMNPISKIDGVEKITPQLYLASLSASCCAVPLQLLAFDPETDFIIQPWMEEMDLENIGEGEIVVGNSVSGQVGENITFYNTELKIVGRLENTDTSYDTCAFINFDTAKILLSTEEAKKSSVGKLDVESVISTIAIRAEKGVDVKMLARTINYGVDDCPARAYTTNGITSSVTASVDSFTMFTKILNSLLFVMAVLAIVCIFTLTILQRKNEFGVMLTIGATRKDLISIILTEGIGVSLTGGILGLLVSGGIMMAFRNIILIRLGIPTFISDMWFYVKKSGFCLGIAVLTGVVASVFAIILVTRKDTLSMIQEGNS